MEMEDYRLNSIDTAGAYHGSQVADKFCLEDTRDLMNLINHIDFMNRGESVFLAFPLVL